MCFNFSCVLHVNYCFKRRCMSYGDDGNWCKFRNVWRSVCVSSDKYMIYDISCKCLWNKDTRSECTVHTYFIYYKCYGLCFLFSCSFHTTAYHVKLCHCAKQNLVLYCSRYGFLSLCVFKVKVTYISQMMLFYDAISVQTRYRWMIRWRINWK